MSVSDLPRFERLQQWLEWQAGLNPSEIDLGLERLRRIATRPRPTGTVITVAGTNGKGSSVALLVSILEAAGYRVGAYTSPHLIRYNERIRIDGAPVSDAALCEAFDWVDRARGDIPLTFFEFGTLAAFRLFDLRAPEVLVLEVGLGGRLDAVNLIDPHVALITHIGIDHVDWLGPDRETIGLEKAGILRPGRPAVLGDPDPPAAVLHTARDLDVALYRAGRDFGFARRDANWLWWGPDGERLILPCPALAGDHQLENAAAVLTALRHAPLDRQPDNDTIASGLRRATLAGRFQRLAGAVEHVLDVAHNVDGARVLARQLQLDPPGGRTIAVAGLLRDKQAAGVFDVLWPQVDEWHLAPTEGARGQSAELLKGLAPDPERVRSHGSIDAALMEADDRAEAGDRVLIFGSFQLIGHAMRRYSAFTDSN